MFGPLTRVTASTSFKFKLSSAQKDGRKLALVPNAFLLILLHAFVTVELPTDPLRATTLIRLRQWQAVQREQRTFHLQ